MCIRKLALVKAITKNDGSDGNKKMIESAVAVTAAATSDPSLWQTISGWLWALLAVPLKMLWNKAENAATKQELTKAVDSMSTGIEQMRNTSKELFKAAEEDRKETRQMAMSIESKIHATHIDMLSKIEKRSHEDRRAQ